MSLSRQGKRPLARNAKGIETSGQERDFLNSSERRRSTHVGCVDWSPIFFTDFLVRYKTIFTKRDRIMRIKLIASIVVCVLTLSGCASQSVPLATASIGQKSIQLSDTLPDTRYLPEQSAVVQGTRYVAIQTSGGSVFLGPLLGSLNIAANTEQMAAKIKGSYVDVDPYRAAEQRSRGRDYLRSGTTGTTHVLKPFVFIQKCYDEKYRMSLVFHLEQSGEPGSKWVGRYTYHLSTPLTEQQLSLPTEKALQAFNDELQTGAERLYKIIEQDRDGRLSAADKPIKIGSLYLVGSKMAWQAPEELSFSNFLLLEDNGNEVVIRRKQALISGTVLAGGLTYGVHVFKKNMLHTFAPL